MINPDVEARRMLVREHRAELARDALHVGTANPAAMARRAEWRRLRLLASLLRPRLARRESVERVDGGRSLLEEH